MKKTFLFLLAASAFFSCHKKSTVEPVVPVTMYPDYLVFGYSKCSCIPRAYKITGGELFFGQQDSLQVYQFGSTPLDPAKYELAKVLVSDMPAELFGENGKQFGCGGCLDQPEYYVESKQGDSLYSWRIDWDTSRLPVYLKNYSLEVRDVMHQLK